MCWLTFFDRLAESPTTAANVEDALRIGWHEGKDVGSSVLEVGSVLQVGCDASCRRSLTIARHSPEDLLHAMAIGVLAPDVGGASVRNAFSYFRVLQVIANLLDGFVRIAKDDEVLVDLEEIAESVLAQVRCHKERTSGHGFEDTHVDVVADAVIDGNTRTGIDTSHFTEITLPDE